MKVSSLKTPPHSIEAEQAVLGAVLTVQGALDEVGLSPADFYSPEHNKIWSAVRALQESGSAVDTLTVHTFLESTGKLKESGGTEYLVELASNAASGRNIAHYARIIQDRALARRLISAAHRVADDGYNMDGRSGKDLLEQAQQAFAGLHTPDATEPHDMAFCIAEMLEEMDYRSQHKGQLMGLSTGYRVIDERTGGLANGDLIVMAGRPSMGKSTLVMNIAEQVAMAGQLVVFISLEMPRQALTKRIASSISRLPHERVKKSELDDAEWQKFMQASARVRESMLYIDDYPMLASHQIEARVARVARKRKQAPALVVVDYLQLMCDKGEGDERLSKISRNTKLAAKALGCPVIALSQLNRELEKRPSKRPMMSDLRGSGAIEQDADIIFMLYRDEVYFEKTTKQKGILELICPKFRNGQTGVDYLASNLHICRFDNLQHGYQPPLEEYTKPERGRARYDE